MLARLRNLPPERRRPLLVGGALAICVLVGAGFWWAEKSRYVATDNAYVKADTVVVSPRIEGYVADVLVGDNQAVTAGQTLVVIDTAPIEARLAEARASLAAAIAAARNASARANAEQARTSERAAAIAAAQAEARVSQAEFDRYGKLSKGGWIASQRMISARAEADQARAGVLQAQAALMTQRRSAIAHVAESAAAAAGVEQARAMVKAAEIELDHATIKAPIAGVIGARGVRPGQYVRAGANMLSIVPLGETYVVANFKETQVAQMRLGQRVEIRADAFGDEKMIGRVESFSPATGSEFAMIPIENATGNFTKIVQRVPVRIAVDRSDALGAALRPGLSIEVKVDLKSQGGANFAEAARLQTRLVGAAAGGRAE